ncbi:serine/threonine-protein kinase [Cellulomonas fengjieae]|uniref:non-specific serine/threonine protein kinase n=1 Tax=Cellulomonas fengjieae TaxID=2819978 RepID=A0ABS3SDH0_9CELL|nr:serine/threonine-protein kinase [Cellulomonas fengjieae]MBO3083799.1 serine/threonine protein kinase [Cellulomonas fengjieae]MBO3101452.1 serine/threonine protein kinase [Cellulomonas fengjieae]QVI64911.1 serine/threonine protein kinase [Cellulomonas fengjieae]
MHSTESRTPTSTPLGRRYHLEHPLGRGGSGEVFRATDNRLRRPVALKLFAIGAATPDEIRRYAHEARVLSSLTHPSLVALLDVGADVLPGAGPVAFLVMELVDGRTLRDTIADGPLTPGLTADVGRQLALALNHAHGAGVVHRDVKPSNILVAADRADSGARDAPWMPVVLADFGIALTTANAPRSPRGSSGTAGYQSPEQALGEPAGPATDIYSLGLVLLECLTGERAYPGDPLSSSLARLLDPVVVPAQFGRDWSRLLLAMTAPDAAARPGPAAVAAELRALRV